MYFLWKDEYSINIEEIDNQHKKLFQLGRKLYRVIMGEESAKEGDAKKVMKALKDYIKFHFRAEEEFMKSKEYIHFQSHKNQHDYFVNEICRLEGKSKSGTDMEVLKETFLFIFTWILNHILKEDMKLKEVDID